MKRYFLLFVYSNIILFANAQSWIIEGFQQNFYEYFSYPVELENGNIFVSYSNYDKANNGNVDSSRQYVEIRTHEGQLLKSRRIHKPDTRLYLKNAVKFHDKILLLSNWYSFITNKYYAGVQLIDENLDPVFEKVFHSENSTILSNDIHIESDTTAIIFMHLESNTNGTDSAIFVRISNTGNIQHYQNYFKKGGIFLTNIIDNFTNDSFVVLGNSSELILDRNLNPIYEKESLLYTTDRWGALIKFKGNQYLWLKALINNKTNYADIGLIQFNKNFDSIKTIRIGNPNRTELTGLGSFYNPQANNSVYMLGVPDSPPLVLVNVPIIITRLDINLNVIWTKYYDNNHLNSLPTIYATADGGILLGGYKLDIMDPNILPKAYLIKIDSSGNFPTSTKNEGNNLLWSATVFPNPSSGILKIELDKVSKDLYMEIFDINSRLVYRSKILQAGKHSFDLSFLLNGTYVYSIIFDGKESASGKWVKQE